MYGEAEIKFEVLVREDSYNQTAIKKCFVIEQTSSNSVMKPWAPFVSLIRPVADSNGVPPLVCLLCDEYLKRLFENWRVVATLEDEDDELVLIGEVQ